MDFQYAPAPESRSVVDIRSSYGLFINGEFVDGRGESFKSINPATEETIGTVAYASCADLDEALEAAAKGFRTWRATSACRCCGCGSASWQRPP